MPDDEPPTLILAPEPVPDDELAEPVPPPPLPEPDEELAPEPPLPPPPAPNASSEKQATDMTADKTSMQ
ncbi:MAG: hypothetical protein A2Y07_06050 [Planctomycetes bacterium GWF2_50_10]|nr:MAG: hypothetical protein A2Y07_06050 [Planctomycetes bacterium GWF2_50_10]